MADVFISHSSIDKEIANKLCESLEARGLKCWIAPRDIVPGTEWPVAISNAISVIKVMVVIYSRNSANSTQVPKELALAEKRGKFIIPYKIDDTELVGAFDYFLTGAHWIVADPKNGDDRFDELYGVMSGVMQVPLQSVTNNTYIDKVTIHNSVSETEKAENNSKGSKNKKVFATVAVIFGILLSIILLLIILLSKQDKELPEQSGEVLQSESVVESQENGEQDSSFQEVGPSKATDDFEYIIEDGKASILWYRGTSAEVIIPAEIEGAAVTYIEKDAFYQCTGLKSVVIPESVIEIGAWAFAETGLTEVTIPSSVKKIGKCAFGQCVNLEKVEMQKGLKEIATAAFAETALKEVVIPSSVTTMGDSVFSGCKNLITAKLPEYITKISDYMFCDCINLSELNIPDTVSIIGEFAFSQTPFETVTIAETNIFQIGAGAFSECPYLTTVELPNALVKIDAGAFQLCDSLESVMIPDDIITIEANAFYESENVRLSYKGSTYTYADYGNLVEELRNKLVGDFEYEIVDGNAIITKYVGSEEFVVIPYAIEDVLVTAIGADAFANNDSMYFVSIPYDVQVIEPNAFWQCTGLTEVAGGNSILEMGFGAYCATSIREASIPEGQTEVGYCAFCDCPYLSSVTIPDSVTYIDEHAFAWCPSLTELVIPDSVTGIASNAFEGSANLTVVYKGHRYNYEKFQEIPVMVTVTE